MDSLLAPEPAPDDLVLEAPPAPRSTTDLPPDADIADAILRRLAARIEARRIAGRLGLG